MLLVGCQSPIPQSQPAVPPVAPPAGPPQTLPPATPVPPPEQKTAGPLQNAGAYMDRQERGLRRLLRGTAIRVMRQGNDLVVVLPSGRMFTGSVLSEDGYQILHTVARVLRYFNHTQIRVNGYTDTRGSFAVNVARSQRLADRVLAALIRQGIPETRMQAHGFGPTNLRVPTGENVREPRNRRIELVIVPNA